MPMYKSIECSEQYCETLGSLRQYYRDHLALDKNENIIDFPVNDDTNFHLV